MARWITVLLLLFVIAEGIKNEPAKIEQRLHAKIVLALADDDLSEVRVTIDGRDVLLSGSEKLIPQALTIVKEIPGIRQIKTQVVNEPMHDFQISESKTEPFVQVIHPDEIFWPRKHNNPVKIESELLIKKMHRSVEVNGLVPNNQIKQTILAKIEQYMDIPEPLFDVAVTSAIPTPDWFSQGMPLFIPFVQWVEEGQLQYQDNRILLDGTVPDRHAWKAIETAIANVPSKFKIENSLRIATNYENKSL